MTASEFTHLDPLGRARMVDVTAKDATHRRAVARCRVHMEADTAGKIASGAIAKGDVLAVARVAGIQAAKRTAAELQRQLDKTNSELERQRLAQEHERQKADQEAERNRSALALADRLQRERNARKDAAWAQFYKPSPACQADSGTTVCANEYMASRKRFEAQYVDR